MAREFTELEQQFMRDMENAYPGYFVFKPHIQGFLALDTNAAFCAYSLAIKLYTTKQEHNA